MMCISIDCGNAPWFKSAFLPAYGVRESNHVAFASPRQQLYPNARRGLLLPFRHLTAPHSFIPSTIEGSDRLIRSGDI
ncbi:protein of unknown function [Rhodovastum atsumiense]|nr:protein of unknown function [Rhodovastum atsumiense]